MERSRSRIPAIVRHLPGGFRVLHTSHFLDLFKWRLTVGALYLPHNYELTAALFELKDHHVTVNHGLRKSAVGWNWYNLQPPGPSAGHELSARFASCKKRGAVLINPLNLQSFVSSDWIASHQSITRCLLVPPATSERIKRCWNHKRGGASIAGGLRL